MELLTERLRIRQFQADDTVAVHDYASDPEVVRYNTFGPNSEEQTESYIEDMVTLAKTHFRGHFEWAVALKESETLIGSCSLVMGKPDPRQGEIGFVLNRNYWGHGYATEAAGAVLKHGFTDHGLHRIFARCQVENQRSIRVLERLGMRREGFHCQSEWIKEGWKDILVYALLKCEWTAQ
jgi:RimJ/RimL family protein N-acetyltransferase